MMAMIMLIKLNALNTIIAFLNIEYTWLSLYAVSDKNKYAFTTNDITSITKYAYKKYLI
jgi:hypothetical protein